MKRSQTEKGSLSILLVEDNPGDIILVREALKEITRPIALHVVRDGVEATEYLRQEGTHKSATLPDLVILDINLPKKDGFEVLRDIKTDPARPELKAIPVVVFTISRSDPDILKTYGLGGACLITKPLGFYEFMEAIKSILKSQLKVEINK